MVVVRAIPFRYTWEGGRARLLISLRLGLGVSIKEIIFMIFFFFEVISGSGGWNFFHL
jgi:hypothetical protein